MEFLALVYGDPDAWERLSESERTEAYEGYMAVSRDASAAGALVDAAQLEATTAATSIRVRNGETIVTDGPYAEVAVCRGEGVARRLLPVLGRISFRQPSPPAMRRAPTRR